jgi:hypothetical protein
MLLASYLSADSTTLHPAKVASCIVCILTSPDPLFTAVEDVNNCMGRRSSSSANPLRGPVPKTCEAAVQQLQDCLEEQQRLQEVAEAAQRRR